MSESKADFYQVQIQTSFCLSTYNYLNKTLVFLRPDRLSVNVCSQGQTL